MRYFRISQQESNAPPTRRLDVSVATAFVICILLLIPLNFEQIFLRDSLITKIAGADLPLTCTSRDIGLPLPVYRSSIPDPSVPFCGVVFTENGPFRVIENGMIVLGAMSRADIISTFEAGCSVKLSYFGWGERPGLRDYYTPNPKLWIYAVEKFNDCNK
jgi:hypothetical protein